jgi:hypothetical protein
VRGGWPRRVLPRGFYLANMCLERRARDRHKEAATIRTETNRVRRIEELPADFDLGTHNAGRRTRPAHGGRNVKPDHGTSFCLPPRKQIRRVSCHPKPAVKKYPESPGATTTYGPFRPVSYYIGLAVPEYHVRKSISLAAADPSQ